MTTHAHTDPPDLRDYIAPVLRRWPLILGIVACCAAATYVYFDRQTRVYDARTAVFFEASEVARFLIGESDFGTDRAVVNQSGLFKTRAVAGLAARRAGVALSTDHILQNLTVKPRAGQDFLDIVYRDTDPRRAAEIANRLAQAFISVQSAETRNQLQRSRDALQRQLQSLPRTSATSDQRAQLVARVEQLDAVSALPSGSAKQINRAAVPATPSSPKPSRNALFAFVMGLLLAIGAAFGLDRFDRRVREVMDVEDVYGQPVLGAVPHTRESDLTGHAFEHGIVESMRTLRANIELNTLDDPVRRVMVCSAEPEEGKSTVVRHLAFSYAQAGKNVLIVECDLRKPVLAKAFGLPPGPGLVDVIGKRASVRDAVKSVPVPAEAQSVRLNGTAAGSAATESSDEGSAGRITLLCAGMGAANPLAVLGSERLWSLITGLEEHHDLTLFDSAPLLVVGDGLQLLPRVDSALLVVRLGRSTRTAGRSLVKLISRAPTVRVLGVVANGVRPSDREARGYYYADSATAKQASRI